MKFVFVLSFAALLSCSAQTAQGASPLAAGDDQPDSCVASSYQLLPEAVNLWLGTWLYYHRTTYGRDTPYGFDTPASYWTTLQNKVPDAIGVRMYYGLYKSTDTIPVLLITNVWGCSDTMPANDATPILMLGGATTVSWVSTETAATYTQSWRSLGSRKANVTSQVYAYNYSWATLNDIIDTDGLVVSFGMRTIAPEESEFEQPTDGTGGSVVYVNVLSGSDQTDKVDYSYDFTLPCPKMCGTDSPLNSEQ